MAWRRGNQSTDIELSRLQTKVEDWSDIFDGEDGMIRLFQAETAIRDEREKQAHERQNRYTLFFAGCAAIPVILEILHRTHVLQ